MSAAIKYAPRYDADDHSRWQGDWELWDGIAIAMTPSPFGRHQKVLFGLSRELSNALRSKNCDATVLGELDWVVRRNTIVRPDVVVVCGDAPDKHQHDPPDLIAEVLSPSTRQNDLTFKRELYASEGVGTYLIVDPDANTIEHLLLSHEPQSSKLSSGERIYESIEVTQRLRLKVCNDCEIEIDPSEIW